MKIDWQSNKPLEAFNKVWGLARTFIRIRFKDPH